MPNGLVIIPAYDVSQFIQSDNSRVWVTPERYMQPALYDGQLEVEYGGLNGATTDDLPEGSNLYFTNERVDDRVSTIIQNGTGINWTYDDVGNTFTGNVTITQYTDEQAQDATASLIQNGTGITWSYNDGANTLTPTVTITQYTDELAQDATASLIQNGTGISWSYNDIANTLTPTVSLSSFNTGNLSEGSNLYYTDERVDDRVAVLIQNGTGITWSYNDGAGTLTPTVTVTQYTDEMAQDAAASLIQNGTGISWSYNDVSNTLTPTVSLSSFSTTNLVEGTGLYYTDERVDDRVAALIQNGSGITWSYNDGSNTLTPSITDTARTPRTVTSNTTVTATDGNNIIYCNSTSALTVTLPKTSTESISANFTTRIINIGTGDVTVLRESGDIFEAQTTLISQHDEMIIRKRTAGTPNTWEAFDGTLFAPWGQVYTVFDTGISNGNVFYVNAAIDADTIITDVAYVSKSGTGTGVLSINGSNMTSPGISFSSTLAYAGFSAGNSAPAGSYIQITFSSVSSLVQPMVALRGYRRL